MATRYSLVVNGTQIQELQTGDSLLGSISNLTGGTAGGVPWQSAASTTGFVSAGTTGQFLQSNGTSAPTWVTPPYASTGKAIAMSLIFGF
jgi:hypothetical protein